jgi:glucosamine--fructose-6-phosphate aminotransferase (isomerizing)
VIGEVLDRENWLFLGRGYNYPDGAGGRAEDEGNLVHPRRGMPAAEMKHGPIALINENMPAVFIAPRIAVFEKVISNIQEVKSRKRLRIIAVATEGNRELEKIVDRVIYVPPVMDPLQPLLTVVPLQLLAYYVAVGRGLSVDKPRNLAKSVTVE